MNDRALSTRHAFGIAASVILWFLAIGVALVARNGCGAGEERTTPARDAGADVPTHDGETLGGLDAAADADPALELPSEIGEIVWPAAPETVRELEESTPSGIEVALAFQGTEVHVTGQHEGTFLVRASDIAIELDDDATLEPIYLEQGVRRIAIRGGQVGLIELEQGYSDAPPRWRVADSDIAPYREPPAR